MAAASYVLAIFAPTLTIFLVARFLSAFFAQSGAVAYRTIVTEVSPSRARSAGLGLVFTITTLGIVPVPLILSYLGAIHSMDYAPIFYYALALDAVAAILGWLVVEEPPIFKRRKELLEKGELKEERVPLRKLVSSEYLLPFILMAIVSIFGFVGTSFTLANYNPTIESTVLRLPVWLVGVVEMIFIVNGSITLLSFSLISDRIGRLNSFILSGILMIIGAPIAWHLSLLTMPAAGPATLITLVIYEAGILTYEWGAWSPGGYQPTWFSELFPTGIRATAQGISMTLANLAGFLVTLAIGVLSPLITLPNALILFGELSGVAVLIVGIVAKRRKLETKGTALKI